jgi:hypothetical protein
MYHTWLARIFIVLTLARVVELLLTTTIKRGIAVNRQRQYNLQHRSCCSIYRTFDRLATADSSIGDAFSIQGFQPICPTSDVLYQFAKSTSSYIIGDNGMSEFGPLIASVLLRMRLEFCVFESFYQEAVLPFVRTHGFGWVLPLHETAEALIAGVIFALAANFVLLGSTKIFAVMVLYADLLVGSLLRAAAWVLRLLPAKEIKEAGSAAAALAALLGAVRGLVEGVDTFVGRYLVVGTTVYVLFRIAHFKLFNDLFP